MEEGRRRWLKKRMRLRKRRRSWERRRRNRRTIIQIRHRTGTGIRRKRKKSHNQRTQRKIIIDGHGMKLNEEKKSTDDKKTAKCIIPFSLPAFLLSLFAFNFCVPCPMYTYCYSFKQYNVFKLD